MKGFPIIKYVKDLTLPPKPKYFGLTYLTNNIFKAHFYETLSTGNEQVAIDEISLAQASEEEIRDFKKRIHMYFKGPITWIHLILRPSAVIKTFHLPEDSSENEEILLTRRVAEEIPHLVDEIVYHAQAQKAESNPKRGVLFGVPKTVLKEQGEILKRFDIIPDRMVLSTEILNEWNIRKSERYSMRDYRLLMHTFEDHMELLYVRGPQLLQSQWLRKDPTQSVETLIQNVNRDFQKTVEVPSPETRTVNTFLNQITPATTVEKRAAGALLAESVALYPATIEACLEDAVFDFSPSEIESERLNVKTQQLRKQLSVSVMAFCFGLCIWILAGLMVHMLQSSWLHFKSTPIIAAVGQTKELRQKAIKIRAQQIKKNVPVLLLQMLASTLPTNLLLIDVNYDASQKSFSLQGEAGQQSSIDEFMQTLQNNHPWISAALNRVEATTNAKGLEVFRFEVAGRFNLRNQDEN